MGLHAIGIVTAQSTTGTGIWSDFTSFFTDTFGAQSTVYNEKIAAGERLCTETVRMKALNVNANAILGADIDYAEVGGDKAMLMVCMTGTAVRLKDPSILEEDVQNAQLNLIEHYRQFLELNNILADSSTESIS